MQYRFWCVGAVLLMALASPVRAQVTIPQEYDKLIKKNGEIAAFGAEGFGDKVDLNSGSLQIVQVDVDLPGNNALPVRVARRFATGDRFASGHFGAWNLDIPYAHGVFANHVNNPKGWTVGAAGVLQADSTNARQRITESTENVLEGFIALFSYSIWVTLYGREQPEQAVGTPF